MDPDDDFEKFFSEVEPRLRRALVAAYGFERGREAAAEALGWAWEHWERLQRVQNKLSYLFRVGQSRSRRRKEPIDFVRSEYSAPWVEPGLGPALASLSDRQRIAVVLVHGFSWTFKEVADLTGIRETTVHSHVERAMKKLRASMEVANHA
jgi:DNA-directed RNA polymerase specialized sigma24 family protein